jgi:predicted flavoprotein YhiN
MIDTPIENRDYRKLIKEARHGTKGYSEGDLRSLAKSLADVVEALMIEMDNSRNHRVTLDQVEELAAERDALQARIDAATNRAMTGPSYHLASGVLKILNG